MREILTFFHKALCRAAVIVPLTSAPFLALAQEQSEQPASHAANLGDLMIVAQLRHAKLWYAAKLGNWPLAAYEADRLSATLQRASSLRPDLATEPAAPIAEAIAAQDQAAFDDAFHEMTNRCNSCHMAADVGFIQIRVPARASPYSNQIFGDP